jgi:hypothetical protein
MLAGNDITKLRYHIVSEKSVCLIKVVPGKYILQYQQLASAAFAGLWAEYFRENIVSFATHVGILSKPLIEQMSMRRKVYLIGYTCIVG